MALERRLYHTNPIREAVCEFHFESGQFDPIATPSRYWSEVRDIFDGRSDIDAKVDHNRDVSLRYRIYRKDEKALTLLFPGNRVTVNVLAPYESWEVLRDLTVSTMERYGRAFPSENVRSLSVRYINDFDMSSCGSHVDLAEYFNVRIPADLGGPSESLEAHNFHTRSTLQAGGVTAKVKTTMARIVREGLWILLDIDVGTDFQAPISIGESWEVLAALKTVQTQVFEGWITDQTRSKVLKGEKSNANGR